MRIPAVLIPILLVTACSQPQHIDDDLPDASPMHPPDLATPVAKCAAAKGLAGDNLLCVDFKDVQDLSSLTEWEFYCFPSRPWAWSATDGKLQIISFSTFMASCQFKLPALSAADYAKYSSFTLSVVQTVDLNPTQQSASILLGADLPAQRIWTVTGKYAKMTTALQLAKPDLPNGGSGAYQPLFKINSAVGGGGYMGLQIESIAINGIP
jgi:hypothetical protein